MSTNDHENISVTSKTCDNQKDLGQENIENEEEFPNRVPQRDLLSTEQCKDENYGDEG